MLDVVDVVVIAFAFSIVLSSCSYCCGRLLGFNVVDVVVAVVFIFLIMVIMVLTVLSILCSSSCS